MSLTDSAFISFPPRRGEGSAARELVGMECPTCVPGDDDVGGENGVSVVDGLEGNDRPVGSVVTCVPLGMVVQSAEVMAPERAVRIEVEDGAAAVTEGLAPILGIGEAEHVCF